MKKKLLIFAFAFCLILPCAFLMTACELGGGSGGEGSNSSVDAFDTALAINGEGVSALGKSVTITSAGTYYFKYVVEDEIPLAHNWKVMFNLAGGTTEEGTITKIEVYNSTKTLVKTIDTPTSNTNHGN